MPENATPLGRLAPALVTAPHLQMALQSARSPTTNTLSPCLQLLLTLNCAFKPFSPTSLLTLSNQTKISQSTMFQNRYTYLLFLPSLKYLTPPSHLELPHPHFNLLKYHIFYKKQENIKRFKSQLSLLPATLSLSPLNRVKL